MQCSRIYAVARPKSVGDVILKGKNALKNGLRGRQQCLRVHAWPVCNKKGRNSKGSGLSVRVHGQVVFCAAFMPVYAAAIWAEGAVARQILSGVGILEGFLSFLCIEKAIYSGPQKITGGWVAGPAMRWDQSSFAQARLRFQARIAAP